MLVTLPLLFRAY